MIPSQGIETGSIPVTRSRIAHFSEFTQFLAEFFADNTKSQGESGSPLTLLAENRRFVSLSYPHYWMRRMVKSLIRS